MCLLVCGRAVQTRRPPLGAVSRPGVTGCQKQLAKDRQQALTPVRMADVHTSRQGQRRGARDGPELAVPAGHGRKQTEAFLSRAAGFTHRRPASNRLRPTLAADRINQDLMTEVVSWTTTCVYVITGRASLRGHADNGYAKLISS